MSMSRGIPNKRSDKPKKAHGLTLQSPDKTGKKEVSKE
jgi:hypothetical protein